MRPDILHVFQENNKSATIYTRGIGGFRVTLYDYYTEYFNEAYFNNEEEAENFAEDWVLGK